MQLPEKFKVVKILNPQTTNGGIAAGDYINLKNALKVWFVFEFTQAVGHATVASLIRATTVAGGGATAVTETFPIWVNEDTSLTDTLVKATDAADETLTADAKNKTVVFAIDPAILADTFDCLSAVVSDSSQATNLVSCTAIIETRYPQATPPSAIID